MDFGEGSGRVVFSAVAGGASGSYGYELPENKGMKYVLMQCLLPQRLLHKIELSE